MWQSLKKNISPKYFPPNFKGRKHLIPALCDCYLTYLQGLRALACVWNSCRMLADLGSISGNYIAGLPWIFTYGRKPIRFITGLTLLSEELKIFWYR